MKQLPLVHKIIKWSFKSGVIQLDSSFSLTHLLISLTQEELVVLCEVIQV